MRLLMWLGLVVLVYFAVRKNFRANQTRSGDTQKEEAWSDNTFPQSTGSKRVEAMLNCAHCQVYFPASEAVVRDTLHYCSTEHADAATQKN
ncbi:PP0621 family protein [Undibacterium flavidum]|uniref:Uncharacterized protein n=1 Tax=Undibacterium flavidum TaxID=2762297 RepID=A0ABR6YDU2_9BURK|nr:PP0621 family protein [Undibacterium flavidum]MBC3874730.1 hypothetical protein [Undibacterium flavidum]